MRLHILHRDPGTRARVTRLELRHGAVETPAFMPVGTHATVKALERESLEEIGVRLILSNTYHLYLRPGPEVIAHAGGLHRFMAWPHNILTDSGGYQVFSLAPFRKIEEEGVLFRSHIDGSKHTLTPEKVVELQGILGSDILMPLDVCSPPEISREEALRALEWTTAWARRSRERWRRYDPGEVGALFGIIQGNFFPDLRRRSAEELLELGLPGYAIGGLSVGESFSVFRDLLHSTAAFIPAAHPRYLMGVGSPDYILEAIEAGIDLFDCVLPTRTARNALALTSRGPLSLRLERNRLDERPLDPACGCRTCRGYSRSYLRHLFKSREILAAMLTTYHNVYFTHHLVLSAREAIRAGTFPDFKRDTLQLYQSEAEP